MSSLETFCSDGNAHTEGGKFPSTSSVSESGSGVAEYLAVEQQKDQNVKQFLEQGSLPMDPVRARKMAPQKMLFVVIDGVV